MATVIHKAGSIPRTEGARCLIAGGKVVFGSVGGGAAEAEACKVAGRVVSTGKPVTLRFNLNAGHAAETGMLCGGEMVLFVEPVSPVQPGSEPLIEKLKEASSGSVRGLLVTLIDEGKWRQGKAAPKMLIEQGGVVTGSLGASGFTDAAGALGGLTTVDRPELRHFTDETGFSGRLFVEPVAPRQILYVFGGGHVSRALAGVAGSVDFEVVIVDDRPEYSRPEDFPRASKVLCYPFENVLDRLDVDRSSYLVIATRGHLHDMEVLMQALLVKARYLGMVGSSRKREAMFDRLVKAGFTKDDFARVHTPIGLDIGAETPAEIAVSITAELIRVRAGLDEGMLFDVGYT